MVYLFTRGLLPGDRLEFGSVDQQVRKCDKPRMKTRLKSTGSYTARTRVRICNLPLLRRFQYFQYFADLRGFVCNRLSLNGTDRNTHTSAQTGSNLTQCTFLQNNNANVYSIITAATYMLPYTIFTICKLNLH